MTDSRNPWVLTYRGHEFDLVQPLPQMIDIFDIAYSLARQQRFCGHASAHCTVALHSVIVSALVPEGYKTIALLHDAAEAYTGDIPKPLKSLLQPAFGEIEHRINAAIGLRYSLTMPGDWQSVIEKADLEALKFEREFFMGKSSDWGIFEGIETPKIPHDFMRYYQTYNAHEHEALFLKHAHDLGLCFQE